MKKKHTLSNSEEKQLQNIVETAKNDLSEYELDLVKFMKHDANNILMRNVLEKFDERLKDSRSTRIQYIQEMFGKLDNNEIIDITELNVIPFEIEALISNNAKGADTTELENVLIKYRSSKRRLKMNQKKLADSDAGKKLMNFNSDLESLENHQLELAENELKVQAKLEAKLDERDKIVEAIEIEKKIMLDDELLINAQREKENLIKICEQYLDAQSKTVFNQIAGSMETMLKKHLLRKGNLVDSISISDYKLSIITDGKVRAINSFSSGEQQMFLISLIFAVLKQANVEVPLILDTFFARIDDIQQNNLIDFISNEMKNQILFIATDSELPDSKINKFNHLNKVYKLENDGYVTSVKEIHEN